MTAVRLTRFFAAEPARVFAALTDPVALAAWFWPASFGTTVTADARPGGVLRIVAAHPAMGVTGEFVEVDAPRRVSFTWRWDGDDEQSLVAIDLSSPAGGGTELRLTHDRLRDQESVDSHEQGWNDCLDRLAPAVRPR